MLAYSGGSNLIIIMMITNSEDDHDDDDDHDEKYDHHCPEIGSLVLFASSVGSNLMMIMMMTNYYGDNILLWRQHSFVNHIISLTADTVHSYLFVFSIVAATEDSFKISC